MNGHSGTVLGERSTDLLGGRDLANDLDQLRTDGYVVHERAVDAGVLGSIRDELAPWQPVDRDNDEDTSPGGAGFGPAVAQVRAERDGVGNGRV